MARSLSDISDVQIIPSFVNMGNREYVAKLACFKVIEVLRCFGI